MDGEPTEMFLTYGTETNGIFTVTVMLDEGAACHEYYFQWTRDGETSTFPEDGSYLFGIACDEPEMWVDAQRSPGGDDEDALWAEDDDKISACAHVASPLPSGEPLGFWALLCGLIWVRRQTPTRPTHRLQ